MSMPSAGSPSLLAQLDNVVRTFGNVKALNGISLDVHAGEAVAFLGPNGAGKSTTISVLLGLLRPTSGQVTLCGKPPWRPAARRTIGATPQETDFPPNLSVTELLTLVASHFDMPTPIPELLADFDLAGLKDRTATKLSGGERRRLALAMAFAGNPEAVFLDEPTSGLDVEARRTFWSAVSKYHNDGGTVFLTTHHMEEAEALAERVILINQGRIVQQGRVADIKARVNFKRLRFHAAQIPDLAAFSTATMNDGWVTVSTPDADELVRTMIAEGVEFQELEIEPVSLEEAVVSALRDPLSGDDGT